MNHDTRCMKRLFTPLVVLFLVLFPGCGSNGSTSVSSVTDSLATPAAPESGQPRLYTSREGTVWMSWLEPLTDEGHALRYATYADTGWTRPQTVATGTNWFVNWADLPAVRPLPNGGAVAHYLESNGSSALAYAVRITKKSKHGAWREPITPHDDGTATEHGFVSLLPWDDGRVLATWLDGRKMKSEGGGHGSGEMTLRSAVLDSTGRVVERALIDGRTCECCATSAVRVGNEALLAYRDRSSEEVRDIYVARYDGQGWTEPTLLHQDDWTIEGCPVNGPALASDGDRVVAAWFTAAGGVPRVKAAFSTDGGRQFGEAIIVSEGNTKGRVDAVLLDDGAAVVSWLDTRNDGEIRARLVRSDSSVSSAHRISELPSAGRAVGFPKMVQRQQHLYFAWVGAHGTSESTGVRTARVRTEHFRR